MDYAIDRVTNKPVTADLATRSGYYICSFCRMRVGLRSGPSRKNYFAHWRGVSSSSCAYFMSGPLSHVNSDKAQPASMRQMDLRLMIKKGENAGAWWIELVLPPCRTCHAYINLDVGGRVQKLNMRGMGSGFRVTAEPTANDYKIISFEGKPDPLFVSGVARTCPGLSAVGAAVFTAIGRDGDSGFPRAQVLSRSETYALLWSVPATPVFPEELLVDRFKSRHGWQLALVTVPDTPSEACIKWLEEFTQLSVMPATPSITAIWPFLTRYSSINTVEYIESEAVILAAHRMPGGAHDGGPTLQAVNQNDRISVTAPDRSPALFTVIREGSDDFRIGKTGHPDVDKYFSKNNSLARSYKHPTVDLVFIDDKGERVVAPLHRRGCQTYVMATRAQELCFDSLAMPMGTRGRLEAISPNGYRESRHLVSSDVTDDHTSQKCQLSPALNSLLKLYITDPKYQIYLDFGGFGRLSIGATQPMDNPTTVLLSLGRSLRLRLRCFLSQLHAGGAIALSGSDQGLVNAFLAARPNPGLVPNYRQLAADVRARGFDIRSSGDGVSR